MEDGASSIRQALEYAARPGPLASEMQRIHLRIGGEDTHAQSSSSGLGLLGPRHGTTLGETSSGGALGGNGGGDGGGASNSQAVLSALRSLQSKIRVLEEERNKLQTSLKLAQEAKEREEQQHRLLQRQLQLQLQESVKALTIRHHSETEAIRDVASKSQAELSREVTHLQHRVAEAEVEVQRLRDKSEQVERENTAKDEEVRRLRVSVADLEAAGVALRRVNQKLETQVAEDEHARRDLVSQNALLEDNIKMLRLAKGKSEESAAQAAQEYAKLEAERIALQREQAMLQGELRHTSDALANKSADMAAAVAQRSELESEKRQLEESLRNVLTINDQLLQKLKTGAPLEDVKMLERELVEEVRVLRRQYRDIVAQVQGTEYSPFDAQQLNLALKSVVEKLEQKGKQISLIERVLASTSRTSGPTLSSSWSPLL